MKKQKKTKSFAPTKKPAQKNTKTKKQKSAVVIELTDEEDLGVQTMDPLKLSSIDLLGNMEVQTKPETRSQPWQDVNGLKVARINHFFKKDGEIWFQVMMGRSQMIYRQPQLLNFTFLSEKYSFQLYSYLLSYFQSHAYQQT